jgi:hypothetical protein
MRFVVLCLVATGLIATGACAAVSYPPLEGNERQAALDKYTEVFSKQIADTWNPRVALQDYPNQTLPTGALTTVVWVIVDELGDVVATDIAKSAAGSLDREALRAVYVCAPLPPPPKGLLYRSSRGLIAGFPLQFTVQVPGEAGGFVPNRFNFEGKAPQVNKPLEILLEL